MNVYAKIGESFQCVGGECPEGYIEMQTERPSPEHIASQDGTWVLPEPETRTTEEKLAQLDAQYQRLVQRLQSDFSYAQMMNDTALMDELRTELQTLNDSYDQERRELENADDQETVYPVPEGIE